MRNFAAKLFGSIGLSTAVLFAFLTPAFAYTDSSLVVTSATYDGSTWTVHFTSTNQSSTDRCVMATTNGGDEDVITYGDDTPDADHRGAPCPNGVLSFTSSEHWLINQPALSGSVYLLQCYQTANGCSDWSKTASSFTFTTVCNHGCRGAFVVNPTNAAMVAEMSTGSTQSFVKLFQENWPFIVAMVIFFFAMNFVWQIIKDAIFNTGE